MINVYIKRFENCSRTIENRNYIDLSNVSISSFDIVRIRVDFILHVDMHDKTLGLGLSDKINLLLIKTLQEELNITTKMEPHVSHHNVIIPSYTLFFSDISLIQELDPYYQWVTYGNIE